MSLVIPPDMIDIEGIESGDRVATAEGIRILKDALNSLLAHPREVVPVAQNEAEVVGTYVQMGTTEGGEGAGATDLGTGLTFGVNPVANVGAGPADSWALIAGVDALSPFLGLWNVTNGRCAGRFRAESGTGKLGFYPPIDGSSSSDTSVIGATGTSRWDEGWFAALDVSGAITGANGLVLGGWQAYTPTLQGSGSDPSGYTGTGRYAVVGKTVHFWGRITANAGWTEGTGAYRISLPVSAGGGATLVSGTSLGNEVGVSIHVGTITAASATHADAYWINGGGSGAAATVTQPNIPFTMANGDWLQWHGTYEIA